MNPDPSFERLERTLCLGQTDRVPLMELIVDPEIKSRFLGRPVTTVQDDVEFWYRAGYDYVNFYPRAPVWFDMVEERPETVIEDAYTAGGTRRWASEGKGIIQDWDDLERFPPPRIDEVDFSAFDEVSRYLPDGMGVIGSWGDIFTYAWEAMGFTEFCYALYEREELVAHLFQALGELAEQIYQVLVSYDVVKALWYSDDLAYATGLLVSPDVYRRYLFPWVKKFGDLARKRGLPFLYHTDGVLWEIFDDFIECGVIAMHPIEPKAMDIREVKRRYGDRLCLIGNVSVDTLARGTPEEVVEEVKWLLREVAPGGGYCLGSSNTIANYVKLENYQAMLEAAREYGRYPIRV